MSALTDAISCFSNMEHQLNAKMAQLENSISTKWNNTTKETGHLGCRPTANKLIKALLHKSPNCCLWMNGGKGLRHRKHCWKCGCTTTHWTQQHPFLGKELIKQHKKANFQNTMGSKKNSDCMGKCQSEFGSDGFGWHLSDIT